eukprot:jgi/Botrbrau1/11671/Bobra.0195s0002.1
MLLARRTEALDWDIKSTSGVCYFTVASQVISFTVDTACYSTHNKSVAGLNTLVPGHTGKLLSGHHMHKNNGLGKGLDNV